MLVGIDSHDVILKIINTVTAHAKLQKIILVNCGFGDAQADLLFNKLSEERTHIWHIDLSQNQLTQHAIPPICEYLKHENGMRLASLELAKNQLSDSGIQILAVGLYERYLQLDSRSNSFTMSTLPLQYLGVSDNKITDSGFKNFLQRFEAIYLRTMQSQRDYEFYMDLDVSMNNLNESSLKYLADIIKRFHGFRSLNLSGFQKIKDNSWIEFFRSLKESTSILKIDVRKNHLPLGVMLEITQALSENYVISEVLIDLKGKTIPFGFSSYFLQSMY